MDERDRRLLDLLRRDARQPIVGLAKALNLSRSATQERLAKLQSAGIIDGFRSALFMSLGLRWRHVLQGPDGYLYALTEKRTLGGQPDPSDATSGVVFRIEPAQ